ncbi:hypothetical protein Tco_0484501, partial [Tanacetum coccineum]
DIATYSASAEEHWQCILYLDNHLTKFVNLGNCIPPEVLFPSIKAYGNDQRLKMLLISKPESFGYQSPMLWKDLCDSWATKIRTASKLATGANLYNHLANGLSLVSLRLWSVELEVQPACALIHAESAIAILNKMFFFVLQIITREPNRQTFQDLWQAVVLFELAWLDFHELVLMDDLCPNDNGSLEAESIVRAASTRVRFRLSTTLFCSGVRGVEISKTQRIRATDHSKTTVPRISQQNTQKLEIRPVMFFVHPDFKMNRGVQDCKRVKRRRTLDKLDPKEIDIVKTLVILETMSRVDNTCDSSSVS